MDWAKVAFFASFSFVVGVAIFIYGVAVGRFEIFPYDFARESYWELQHLRADLFRGYERFIVTFKPDTIAGFSRPKTRAGSFAGAIPLIRVASGGLRGYRVIVGIFDFGSPKHAALLLAPDYSIVHIWYLNEDAVETDRLQKRPDGNKFPHGFHVLRDGSIIFTFDGSSSLQRFDWCSRPVWLVEGEFHHTVSEIKGQSAVWTLMYRTGAESAPEVEVLAKIDVDSGRLVSQITMDDIVKTNPEIGLFNIMRRPLDQDGAWLPDPFHLNDVDELPAILADDFPTFAAGDLIVSSRALNALFVLDPTTLEVKWWRVGAFVRQHDPDWQPGGKVSVFDNAMYRASSRIVSVDPERLTTHVLFDGAQVDFFTWRRGKHQILPDGSLLISVPEQGRIIELSPLGEVAFELLNTFDGKKDEQLLVSEAIWLPETFFNFDAPRECGNER